MEDPILDRPIEDSPSFEIANKSSRVANYFIDLVLFYLLVFFIPSANREMATNDSLMGLQAFGIYLACLTCFEYLFGKTPGKFATRTHVVTEDGQSMSFMNALGRNLCRLIPFDALSFLFSNIGWHDSISRTLVVYDK